MDKKGTILIVDDIDINCALLEAVFEEEYDIITGNNGREAINLVTSHPEISALLLDLKMPEVDGLDVLRYLNECGIIKKMPVFLITAVEDTESLMQAYELGAIDVVTKPFFAPFLKHRVGSIIELYDYRNKLEIDVYEKNLKLNQLMSNTLEVLEKSLEFRDCESGEHIRRICDYTGLLMRRVSCMFPEYKLSEHAIDKITVSAALHDIGKIAIPDSILGKPEPLTDEEREIINSHTTKGCEMLDDLPELMDEEIYHYGYDICRWHHERYDGRGYPDKLVGDDIPIWAQVAGVADVYDALTSPRVYKRAFSHDEAIGMIKNGECGVFNPKVIEAFGTVTKEFKEIKNQFWGIHK